MLVFFNGASFDNQEGNIHDSGSLLLVMMEAVEKLITIGARPTTIYRDSEIRDRTFVKGSTFRQVTDVLRRKVKVEDEERALQQTMVPAEQADLQVVSIRLSQFISYLTQSPLASDKFGEHVFDCLYGDRDVSHEATGYTAHFTQDFFEGTGSTAVAISLQGSPLFAPGWLNILYMQSNLEETRAVWNVTNAADVASVARTFEHHDKHTKATVVDGVTIAAMDLCGMDAQDLLNKAVKLSGEDRLFARHKGRIYVFPATRKEDRLYHGYPVEPLEVRQRMTDIASALYRHFKWEELKP